MNPDAAESRKSPRARRFAGIVATAFVAACDVGDPSHPSLSTSSTSDPAAAAAGGNGRNLRRLSRREYNSVVHDLLGDSTQPGNQFGLEVYVNGFDNGSDGLTVQGTDLDAFQAAAEALAAQAVRTNLASLMGGCNPQANEAACVTAFLSSFPKRAYRRPPTDTETQRLRAVYTAGAAVGGFSGGIQLMLEAILQSPAFLYREELGAPDPSLQSGVVRLTDYEVASELSFLVTGSMPDAALFAAVDGGTFKNVDDFKREATRLITSGAAKPGFRSFLHQWLATDGVASLSKDSSIYGSFNPPLAASMAGELDRYFDQVLWAGTGSLRELLTSTQSFVDPALAALYNVNVPSNVPGPAGSSFQAVNLDARTRQGVLTRAGFLTVHSDTDSSGPVPRGVFVLNAMLCSPPSPPPANIPPAPPASSAISNHQTTRQRFDAHLNQSFCKGCHSVIDGVGFGFEEFDGIGAYRTTENGSPVDPSGTLLGTDVDGPFMGASQLATKLVGSKELLGCFVKQAYRFAMGQEESAPAAAVLAQLGSGFTADSRLSDVFVALVAEPAFVLRSTMQVGVQPGVKVGP